MENLGFVLMVIGGLWIVFKAFSESLLLGIACLVIPFVTLYFAITRFQQVKTPFALRAIGWLLVIVGVAAK